MKSPYPITRTYFIRKMQNASNHNWPEGKLAVAVIIGDYVDWEREARYARGSVLPSRFLSGDWGNLKLWCDVAGLDMEYVKETYARCYNTIKKWKVKK